MASALIRCMHSLTVYLFRFCSSQHFTDNNDMVTMLIAPRTAPHYHPLSKLTEDEAKLWFIDRTDGLGILADALTAFQGEVSDPTDLIVLGDSDVNAIQRSLGTREYDATGKAKPTFKLSTCVLLRLKGAIKLVNYLSMVRRDIHWEQLQWTNLRNFMFEWDALMAVTKKTQGGEPPVWKRGQQTKTVSFLYSVTDYLNTVYGQYHCPLGYLIDKDAVRDDTLPATNAPPLIPAGYYLDKHNSLMTELWAWAPRFTAMSQALSRINLPGYCSSEVLCPPCCTG